MWKRAVILPVFNKRIAGDVTNYRRISLTCFLAKSWIHTYIIIYFKQQTKPIGKNRKKYRENAVEKKGKIIIII